MSIPTSIQVELPHMEGTTWTNSRGQEFTVNLIKYWAFSLPERVIVDITVFGETVSGEKTNASIYSDDHPFEQPPAWFKAAVEEMRASVEPANA